MNPSALPLPLQTFGLLVLSNLFMTFAWYGQLKHMAAKPWLLAALVSWGIALFDRSSKAAPSSKPTETAAT